LHASFAVTSPVFCLAASLRAADGVTVAGPDGKVQFRFAAGAKGHLEYTVTFGGKPIIQVTRKSTIVSLQPTIRPK
jgi:hypothetical protein